MIFKVLGGLSLIATVWCSPEIGIIQNDGADSKTSLSPIYSPPSVWKQASFPPRSGDTNPANLTGPANVTTTVLSQPQAGASMSLIFQGTAIQVVFVLTSGPVSIDFVLDDEPLPLGFSYIQTTDYDYYNATVYSNSSLGSLGTGPSGMHNLTIVSPQYAMSFDFALYTLPDNDSDQTGTGNTPNTTSPSLPPSSLPPSSLPPSSLPPSTSPSIQPPTAQSHSAFSTGAIVGVVIGAIVIVCAGFILIRLVRNRGQRISARSQVDLLVSEPYPVNIYNPPTIKSITELPPISPTENSPPQFVPPHPDTLDKENIPNPRAQPNSNRNSARLVEEIAALSAQLARLEAQSQLQTTSTHGLQTQIAYLQAQLSSSPDDEPPPNY